MKAYWKSEGIAPRIFVLGTRWKRVRYEINKSLGHFNKQNNKSFDIASVQKMDFIRACILT